MTYSTLRISEQAGVQTIQLYRPAARNAIDQTLGRELSAALRAVENDLSIKVIVLEGLPDVFCSGMDFQEYVATASAGPADEYPAPNADAFAFLWQLSASSKIIVAKVRGSITAGGIGLVAASDLVIAEEGASFALSELLFGLLPANVLPFLVRRLGYQKATLLALSTQSITTAEAHRWGLVDAYGRDPDQLLLPYLQRWRRLSPVAIRRLKRYMNHLYAIDAKTQTLAFTTIADLLADPEIKHDIRLYVEEGIAPWSR